MEKKKMGMGSLAIVIAILASLFSIVVSAATIWPWEDQAPDDPIPANPEFSYDEEIIIIKEEPIKNPHTNKIKATNTEKAPIEKIHADTIVIIPEITIVEEKIHEEIVAESEPLDPVASAEATFGIDLPDGFIANTEYSYEYTQEDLDYLTMVLVGECHELPIEEQLATGSVVLNRLNSKFYNGNTVKEIVLEPKQYSCFYDGNAFREATNVNMDVAYFLLENGPILPQECIFQSMFIQGEGIYMTFPSGTIISYLTH